MVTRHDGLPRHSLFELCIKGLLLCLYVHLDALYAFEQKLAMKGRESGGPCLLLPTAVLHFAFSNIVLAVIKETAPEDRHNPTDHQERVPTKTCHKPKRCVLSLPTRLDLGSI